MSGDWLNRCHFGDVRDVLKQMIADGVKVNTIVTSPPYWGLRSYLPENHPDKAREIGSEPTLREFIETMTGVMMLAREVLADDGTMWMNMGDSYATRPNGPASANATALHGDRAHKWKNVHGQRSAAIPQGLKNKDLAGQPWRLAFALQDAGWYLRQDVIWHKPNPMPESVTDRCTKAHEYLFLLSKSERYFFDAEAIKEPAAPASLARWAQDVEAQAGSDRVPGKTNGTMKAVGGRLRKSNSTNASAVPGATEHSGLHRAGTEREPENRNRRSVWTVPTQPYGGAHFATFPPALIEPCILAGAPVGGVVLDIFMGSGTTAQVAEKLGRQWIGIDIDIRNKALQDARLRQPSLMLEAV